MKWAMWLGLILAPMCLVLAVWDFSDGRNGWGAVMLAMVAVNLWSAWVNRSMARRRTAFGRRP